VKVEDRRKSFQGRIPFCDKAIAAHLVVEAQEGIYLAGCEDATSSKKGVRGILGEGKADMAGKKLIGMAIEPSSAKEEEILGEGIVEDGIGHGGERGTQKGGFSNQVKARGNEEGQVALEEGRIAFGKKEGGDIFFEGEGVGVPESAIGHAPAFASAALVKDITSGEACISLLVVKGVICSEENFGCAPRDLAVKGQEAFLALPLAAMSIERFGLEGII
jgi:hypothetical protein